MTVENLDLTTENTTEIESNTIQNIFVPETTDIITEDLAEKTKETDISMKIVLERLSNLEEQHKKEKEEKETFKKELEEIKKTGNQHIDTETLKRQLYEEAKEKINRDKLIEHSQSFIKQFVNKINNNQELKSTEVDQYLESDIEICLNKDLPDINSKQKETIKNMILKSHMVNIVKLALAASGKNNKPIPEKKQFSVKTTEKIVTQNPSINTYEKPKGINDLNIF